MKVFGHICLPENNSVVEGIQNIKDGAMFLLYNVDFSA